jgi:hypothetical protein
MAAWPFRDGQIIPDTGGADASLIEEGHVRNFGPFGRRSTHTCAEEGIVEAPLVKRLEIEQGIAVAIFIESG